LDDCIFCRIIAREAPAAILAEDDQVIVFLSLERHPLVVPKSHVRDIFTLSDTFGATIMRERDCAATESIWPRPMNRRPARMSSISTCTSTHPARQSLWHTPPRLGTGGSGTNRDRLATDTR
jgi:hypothetical protein